MGDDEGAGESEAGGDEPSFRSSSSFSCWESSPYNTAIFEKAIRFMILFPGVQIKVDYRSITAAIAEDKPYKRGPQIMIRRRACASSNMG